jgi:hypothetical protein
VITAPVVRLRHELGYPGIVVMHWAFSGPPGNVHRLENHEENLVVYTATHDNDTTLGWWSSCQRAERLATGLPGSDPSWEVLDLAFSSRARLAIAPLQDVLGLGSAARNEHPRHRGGKLALAVRPRRPHRGAGGAPAPDHRGKRSSHLVVDRRGFLVRSGLALVAAGYGDLLRAPLAEAAPPASWSGLRAQFDLDPHWIHLGGLLLASHPAPVRQAIERHRRGLDRNPVHYLHGNEAAHSRPPCSGRPRRTRAPGDRHRADRLDDDGLGLVYNGLGLRRGDDVLTTTHDFYATHEALRLKAVRSGASAGGCSSTTPGGGVDRRDRRRDPARRPAAHPRARDHVGALEHRRQATRAGHRRCGAADRAEPPRDASTGSTASASENARIPISAPTSSPRAATNGLFGPRGTGIVWGSGRGWAAVQTDDPVLHAGRNARRLLHAGGLSLVRAPLGPRGGVSPCIARSGNLASPPASTQL